MIDFNFDLSEILEEQTTERSENSVLEPQTEIDNSILEFDEPTDPAPETLINAEKTELLKEEYTLEEAKENAEILVELLDTINTASLTPLARWKLRKKRGGKTALLKMQEIAEKSFSDEDLTEQEKSLLAKYNAYMRDKEQLEKDIPYTDEEKAKLVKSATSWLHRKKIRVSGDMSFWGEFAMIQGTRVLQILTA